MRWSTPPPSPTKQRLPAKRLTLPDGTTADRVPNSCLPHDHTISFSDGGPGISIKSILKGGSIQNSPQLDLKAGPRKIVIQVHSMRFLIQSRPNFLIQWPGYDPLVITVHSNTRQELAVAVCSALHKFYSWASVGDTLKIGFRQN
jgi:hypothetical protein